MLIFYILISLTLNSVNAMAGGVVAKSSTQYPFSVTLTDPILCGGSIISLDPPWILTAAHCVESYHQNDKPSVMYGNRNFTKQSVATIKRTVMHPLYLTSAQLERQVYTLDKNDLIPYDIALIELTEPLIESDHVKRIPILINDTLTVQEAETIGMGYTGISQPHAELLQSTFCNLSKTETLKNSNFNHSAILVTSDAQLCHGDSGSPLLYKWNNTYYLNGVLNRILNAYDPDPEYVSCPLHNSNLTNFIDAFVKPSSHLPWIMDVTKLPKNALTDVNITAIAHNRDTFSFKSFASPLQSVSNAFPLGIFLSLCVFFV